MEMGGTVMDSQRKREKARERESLTRLTRPDPTRTRDLTRRVLPFPATSPAVLGTDLKLERWATYPCRPCCRKTIGKSPIEVLKVRGIAGLIRRDFARFGWHHRLDFVPHDSLFHFRPSIGTESRCFAAGRLLELTAVELDSGVVAARRSSPPVPLNSAWLAL